MSNGSKFFSVLVVGDNQQELLSEYSISKKVPQYVKYTYLDASKYQERAIKVLQKLLDDFDKIGIPKDTRDVLYERMKTLEKMSSFEYYKELTDGMYYDENGNAMSSENPNGKWSTCHIGRNFSLPFRLIDGNESYTAKVENVDWDFMCNSKAPIYEAAWELVMDGREPTNDQERQILSSMGDKTEYFKRFNTKEEYVSYNSSYWNYAYLDLNGWKDLDSDSVPKGNEKSWVNNFYETFIKPLPSGTTISIYECSLMK